MVSALSSLTAPACPIAADQGLRRYALANALREGAEADNSFLLGGAGDDGAIDGPDRDAGNPVRQIAMFGRRLMDAGLVGGEGAACSTNSSWAELGPRRCADKALRFCPLSLARRDAWRATAAAGEGCLRPILAVLILPG